MDGHIFGTKSGPALPATLVAIAATTPGSIIDTMGYEGLVFTISIGTFATFDGTNKWTFNVEESNVANMSTGVTALVAGDYMRASYGDGTVWDMIADAATDDENVMRIAVKLPTANRRRYMRLVLTEGGIVSAAVAATYTLYNARKQPT